jgi:hypothetical protein
MPSRAIAFSHCGRAAGFFSLARSIIETRIFSVSRGSAV